MHTRICLSLTTKHLKNVLCFIATHESHFSFSLKSVTSFCPYLYIKFMCVYSPFCTFIQLWVSRRFPGFRSSNVVGEYHLLASEVCRLLPPSNSSLLGPSSATPAACTIGTLLNLNIKDLLTCLSTLHSDYRFHEDSECVLLIFICSKLSTILIHGRCSLHDCQKTKFHFGGPVLEIGLGILP
jgi:hypothetical protein